MSAVMSVSINACVAAARPQGLAARRPASPALLAARPQVHALTAQMQGLSMRRSVISAAAAADVPEEEPVVEVEAEAVVEEAAPADGQESIAILRNIRGSPDKVRRVLNAIRGKTYEEALIILEYLPHRACEPILKTLVSAASNAKHNYGMRKAKLVVSTCYCDMGTPLKRIRPRAQGRANRVLKRMSHITIKVTEATA